MVEWSTTHEYLDDEFEMKCPKCGKINIIYIPKQGGHVEPEETRCANCRAILHTFRASNTPRTEIKQEKTRH